MSGLRAAAMLTSMSIAHIYHDKFLQVYSYSKNNVRQSVSQSVSQSVNQSINGGGC